jgi:hypothetical protein
MAMRPDDFFSVTGSDDVWSGPTTILRREILEGLLVDGSAEATNIEVADAIVRLIHLELEGYATNGCRISEDADMELLLRAGAMCCKRAGVRFPSLPFRDLSGFGKYWRKEGLSGGGSWGMRRDYLDTVFEKVENDLLQLTVRTQEDGLAIPISPRSATGWASVDTEAEELRRRFEVARSAQDHSAVGTACVRVLEMLGDVVFDAALYVPSGEAVPKRDQTKNRFDLVIAHELPGSANTIVRKLAKTTVEIAHEVKHRATRRDAGIAADSVILLVHMMRRISEPATAVAKADGATSRGVQ